MKVTPEHNGLFVDVYEASLGHIFECDSWPKSLDIKDYLHALCGCPDGEGWFVYHEPTVEWLVSCLEIASDMRPENIGCLAIHDVLKLRSTPPAIWASIFGNPEPSVSQLAAASLAAKVFARAWCATEQETADIVRMNLFTERVRV